MSAKGQRLSWYRWEWPDPIHPDMWTAVTISVYKPSYDRPFVSVLVSIANGGGRVLMRCSSVAEAQRRTGMPQEGLERLQLAETEAHMILEGINRDLRLIAGTRSLSPGAQIVRTDTGEIIADVHAEYDALVEAEKIARDHSR